MNKLTMALCGLTLAGCATGGYSPAYFYNEVHVHNLSGGSISDVNVVVGQNGRTISCEQVNKNALCADRFGRKRYYQTGIELSWTHPDGSRKTETMNPPVPIYFISGAALRIIIEILEDGSVKPYYEQDEPGRDGGMFISGML